MWFVGLHSRLQIRTPRRCVTRETRMPLLTPVGPLDGKSLPADVHCSAGWAGSAGKDNGRDSELPRAARRKPNADSSPQRAGLGMTSGGSGAQNDKRW
jgi:hypothetical protein